MLAARPKPIQFHFSLSLLVHGTFFAVLLLFATIHARSILERHQVPADVTLLSAPATPKKVERVLPSIPRKTQAREKTLLVSKNVAPTEEKQVELPSKPETPAASANPNALSLYVGNVLQLIERQKKYPPAAQRRGQQGRVLLSLIVNKQGEIVDVRVAEPSAFPDLNDAALEIVRRIRNFPPLPDELKRAEISLQIPVEYKLQ
jgi:TonB family protein